MWIVFALVGILLLALGILGRVVVSLKSEKNVSLAADPAPVTSAARPVPPTSSGAKRGFGFSFPSSGRMKEDLAKKTQAVSLEKNDSPSGSLGLSLASADSPAMAALPQDPLADDKLALKDSQIRQLQEELRLAQEKADEKGQRSMEAIQALQDENGRLRADIERGREAEAKAGDGSDVLQKLREENVEFKAQLEAAASNERGFRDQVETLRREFDDQLARANETITRLQKEADVLRASLQDPSLENSDSWRKKEDAFRAEIEELRRDNESLQGAQASGGLEKEHGLAQERIVFLEKENNDWQEKNKFLQYELTKSRAQVAGLERICEGHKVRLEEMAKEVHAAEEERESFETKLQGAEKGLESLRRANLESMGPGANSQI